MKLILVIDLGTSNTKASLFDEPGTVQFEASIKTPTFFDSSRMEIDQDALWVGIRELVASARASVQMGDTIEAITVSSMACTVIPVDREGRSLHLALSWLEKRPFTHYTLPFLKRFLDGFAIPDCGQYPLAMYPAFKIAWFHDQFPEKAARAAFWINISDFIYAKLLGRTDRYFCDYSIASRTMLFNDRTKQWNPHALREFSIDTAQLSTPLPAGSLLGTVGRELQELGLRSDTRIILGAHDHICASTGAAIRSTDRVLHSTGTSEVLTTGFERTDLTRPPQKWVNVESSAIANENYLVAFCSASGQIFQSFQAALNPSDISENKQLLRAYDTLTDRPLFIPPVRSMQSGITGSMSRLPGVFHPDDLWQSIYEGFAFECRRNLDRLFALTGKRPEKILSVGGQARSPFLTQLRSNIWDIPAERLHDPNISSRGAFIIAAVACGLYDDVMETAAHFYQQSEKDIFIPEKQSSEAYEQFYREHYLTQFPSGIDTI